MAMNANEYLRPGERIDDLQRGGSAPLSRKEERKEKSGDIPESEESQEQCGLRIIQDPSLFCFGMDAVLLSAYVQMKKARRGLDLGTGNGIIPILLSDRTDCAHLTGLEIQPASADLAARSVALNGLEDRISIVQGDIREADRIFASASFDFITCNPPYRAVGSGKVSGTPAGGNSAKSDAGGNSAKNDAGGHSAETDPGSTRAETDAGGNSAKNNAGGISGKIEGGNFVKNDPGSSPDLCAGLDPRAIARHELLCTFDDVARAASRLLRSGGHFYLVHRPLRLPGLITTLCARGLEPKRMRLVYPHVDQAPNMVLLDCVRGGAPELRVEPPLIVYEKDGSYTPELLQIYYE